MARQVVSYSDLEAPCVIHPSVQQDNTSNDPIETMQSTAETNTGRGRTVILDSTHTAYLTSADADTNAVQTQDNIVATVASLPPPKKRKREDANSSADASNLVAAEGQDQHSRTQSQPHADAKSNASKKRKKQGKQGKKQQWSAIKEAGGRSSSAGNSIVPVQHWDDPGAETSGLAYDYGEAMTSESMEGLRRNTEEDLYDEESYEQGDWGDEVEENAVDSEDEDESRNLTHEEIWDDSALIAAWDAANEEYEALHGKKKHWKKDRVHKSPLWYNIPPEPESKNKRKQKAKETPQFHQAVTNQDLSAQQPPGYDNSAPLDFNTFVPTHDASLSSRTKQLHSSQPPSLPEATKTHLSNAVSYYTESGRTERSTHANISGIDQMSADDAFSRALDAMYWCGYWTALYHTRRNQERGTAEANTAPDNGEGGQEVEDEEAILVPAQR